MEIWARGVLLDDAIQFTFSNAAANICADLDEHVTCAGVDGHWTDVNVKF